MQLVFHTDIESKFTLGSVSFDVLDSASIFDKFQEDTDPNSDVIFKTSNTKELAICIDAFLSNSNVRPDILTKLKDFSKFVSESETLTAYIK